MNEDVVRTAPIFADLDDDTVAALRAAMDEVTVRRGEVLFREGEPGDRLFVIASGKVKLGHTAPDGRENLLAILGPGEIVGELSLYDPGARTATATALAPSNLLELDNPDLVALLEDHPSLARQLLRSLAQRLRRTNNALADLVFSDVPGRVAKALLDLSHRFGRPVPGGIRVPHDLTQEELAQLVGASRETVNKSLAEFSARGWIQLDGRAVVLLDVPRLERRAR
ncbi:transcriptional regulator, Crp/Fnr family [Beutenbergia cavernae DSM 12333]|uniref:CRP-like cAMP-activated global transcriptional regulator n=1 Tax=Beutenbergia cavernae (strain ATCC BAA-8 / DSM 12333 / CCUG 43141 / JCM 11478 / NBRC 16432 / NCIMB 13614 / HKI 0122) TaxID=471853 RepID=C5BXX6_BEUC1|nr:Crp/Fnr family transcriptional regulator [Beutenbergia cavernae]ACQ78870.1 transcriptional regulator, Crp/Fnr family [Beutenbergia cavernae DSM 12333]